MQFTRRRVGAILALVVMLSVLLVPAASAAPDTSGPVVYWVQRGDTLYRIAARFGVSAASIASANNIRNWNRIYAGQRLVIPYRYYGPCGYNPCPPPPPPPPPCSYCTCGYYPCPTPQGVGVGNWHVDFYRGTDVADPAVYAREDAQLNFNWGWGPPAAGMPNQYWSGRWQANPNLAAGTYRIQVSADDGVRVYLNNTLVIDAWLIQAVHTYTQDVWLPGGQVNIKVEYFQAEGVSELHYNMWRL